MKTSEAWSRRDPLGEALHPLRMSGSLYCSSDLTAPWGLELPPIEDALMFHFVTSGQCWLEVESVPETLLTPGDLALVPHGRGHRLVSEPGSPAPNLFDLPREMVSERYEILSHGGGGAKTIVLCVVASFSDPVAKHLVSLLPASVTVHASDAPDPEWIHATLRLMASEARRLQPGGETVITRLADILVIQVIRSWIEQDPAAKRGWLGALQDQRIGPALALVHQEPGRDWTVETLAREVAMSRSAFAARFASLVGEPPLHYLARWRMNVALDRFSSEDATVADIAASLGYQSEAAFSRSFKRFAGISPREARRRVAVTNLLRVMP